MFATENNNTTALRRRRKENSFLYLSPLIWNSSCLLQHLDRRCHDVSCCCCKTESLHERDAAAEATVTVGRAVPFIIWTSGQIYFTCRHVFSASSSPALIFSSPLCSFSWTREHHNSRIRQWFRHFQEQRNEEQCSPLLLLLFVLSSTRWWHPPLLYSCFVQKKTGSTKKKEEKERQHCERERERETAKKKGEDWHEHISRFTQGNTPRERGGKAIDSDYRCIWRPAPDRDGRSTVATGCSDSKGDTHRHDCLPDSFPDHGSEPEKRKEKKSRAQARGGRKLCPLLTTKWRSTLQYPPAVILRISLSSDSYSQYCSRFSKRTT